MSEHLTVLGPIVSSSGVYVCMHMCTVELTAFKAESCALHVLDKDLPVGWLVGDY